MEEMRMNNDLKLIEERITILFKRRSKTRYWLQVVDDPYDRTYNFFFNSQRKWERQKSVPLHTIAQHDLSYLETIIVALQSFTQLTIQYDGFTGQRWPSSFQLIQRKRHHDE